MADQSAVYALNSPDNFFGDGDGYSTSPTAAGVSVASAPIAPVASSAPKVGFDVNHHFAAILAVVAVVLIASHHIGLRGVVAV